MAAILLADDDQATLDLVRRALEGDGHAVRLTHDGNEALAAIEAGGAFDLLVTDVDMPGLDGITLAGRAVAASPALKVVLMSGYPEQLTRSTGVPADRVSALGKPFTLEQIRAAVKKALA